MRLLSLPSSNPGYAFVGAVVEVAVRGLGKEFATGVLDSDEGFCGRCCISRNPAYTFFGRVIDTLVRDGDNLAVVRDKVTESAAAAAAVTGNPGDATVG